MKVGITIQGETESGSVTVSGMIEDMHIVYWLLGEARRIIEKRTAEREAGKQSNLIVVKGNLPS